MSVNAVRSGLIDETNPVEELGMVVYQHDPLTDGRAAQVLTKLKPLFADPMLGKMARQHLYVGEDSLVFRVTTFDMMQLVREALERLGLGEEIIVAFAKTTQLALQFRESLLLAS